MRISENRSTLAVILIAAFLNWLLYPSLMTVRSADAADYSTMIIPKSASTAMSPSLIDALAKAFKDTGKFDVIAQSEVDRFLKSKKSLSGEKNYNALFNEAMQLLNEGEKLYNALKVDEAITVLQEAKLKFKEALPSIKSESEYSRFLGTFFYLSMAYNAKELKPQAEHELREMVILDPKRENRKFSSKYYPPEVLEVYKKVRKSVLKGEKGKLSVKSNPSGASVFVDSRPVGNTPLKVNDLPTGEHFISLEKKGFSRWSDSKFVVQGENSVEVDLQESSGGANVRFLPVKTSYDLPKDTATSLDEMGISLGGDIFFLYDYSQKGNKATLSGQLYDQRNQEVSKVETTKISNVNKPADDLAIFAGKMTSYLNSEGYVMSSGLVTGTVANDDGDNFEVEYEEQENIFVPDDQKSAKWGTLPPKRPGQPRAWYEKGWVWGLIIGSMAVTAGSILLFTDVAKAPASRSTLRISE